MAQRPAEFSDSDQQWLDRLRDASAPVSDPRVAREADALRLALDDARQRLQTWDARTPDDPDKVEHEWQRLQFRIRRETAQQARVPAVRRWTWAAGLAASLVLGVGLVPVVWDGLGLGDEPAPVLRGEHQRVQVPVSEPRVAAERLAQALREAGLAPAVHHQAQVHSVDVLLAPEQVAAAAPALQAVGVSAVPGLLRVVFVPLAVARR